MLAVGRERPACVGRGGKCQERLRALGAGSVPTALGSQGPRRTGTTAHPHAPLLQKRPERSSRPLSPGWLLAGGLLLSLRRQHALSCPAAGARTRTPASAHTHTPPTHTRTRTPSAWLFFRPHLQRRLVSAAESLALLSLGPPGPILASAAPALTATSAQCHLAHSLGSAECPASLSPRLRGPGLFPAALSGSRASFLC